MQPMAHLMCACSHRRPRRTQPGASVMSSHTASSARVTRKVVAALLATTVSVVPASYAQSLMNDGAAPSVTVKYSDLNLATTEGSRVLYLRLLDAAQRVCPAPGSPLEIRHNRARQSCIDTAVGNAVKD